ncbi:short subunit dehydrogenase-like uncharacterized protein [Nocardia transvalensis]|uniref:Short subunit dehydrogenase-like uncharacterized protein n=1 Tax=Nocardia transvalensis TaxID=37333 RepID=A0A7W9UKN5_9NOCA|nr:saccharopine dehydrogenase NADP-binding domain-containing protein [Nocardia transvalensis]MBB5916666.1 short subunit dehydrogenase-like uncharacterized protein [Nocardia transvalensis]
MVIAVYGANGYQAKLVLNELARRAIEVRLIGRDRQRLDAAAAAAGMTDADRRVAEVADHAALTAAFAGTDAVINCAGPFTLSGAAVVRAAIDAGTGYVDTAGEQLYVQRVFDTFSQEAERARVTVVPATNDGCLPGDLLAHLIAERSGPLAEITVTHLITGGGGPSRGSLRSALATLDAMTRGGLTYDDGTWHTGIPARHATITLPDGEAAAVAALPLCEVVTIPRHIRVEHVESLVEAALKDRLAMPVTAELIDSLPEGPTDHDRAGQRFTYLYDALDRHGNHIRGIVRGTDTYGTTAVIAAEAATRLAAHDTAPGVLTAAQAFDPADFLRTLSDHDLHWTITEPATAG